MDKFSVYDYIVFKAYKNLSIGLSSTGGRNFRGRVCVYHRGGRCSLRKRFFFIDRFRRLNSFGIILKILKSPYLSGFMGCVVYAEGLISFVLLSNNLSIGDFVFSGDQLCIPETSDFVGSTTLLKNIALFSMVNSVELFPKGGARYVRAAGSFAFLTNRVGNKV